MTEKGSRSLRQFRLSSLIIFTLICAAVFGSIHRYSRWWNQRKQARTSLAQTGGLLMHSHEEPFVEPGFESKPGPAFLIELFGEEPFLELEFLWLHGESVDDQTIDHLRFFPELQFLRLESTLVTSEGLAKLQHVKNLEGMSIWSHKYTCDDLATLRKVRSLRKLNLFFSYPKDQDARDKLQNALPGVTIEYNYE